MNKTRIKGYLILGILFAVTTAVVFAVPTQKTPAFWIVYAFTVVAFAAQLYIWKAALGRDNTLKSKFLGFPVLHIGIVYLIVQLVALAVFLIVPTLPVWCAMIACLVIAGASTVCMLSADVVRSEIERVEAKVQGKVFYIKSLQADVELLAKRETDPKVKAALVQLAEKIRFSDPMSHEQLAKLEAQLEIKVSELKNATNKAEILTEIVSLLDERNRKCKILK